VAQGKSMSTQGFPRPAFPSTESLAAADRSNYAVAGDLSVSYMRVGDVLVAQAS